MLLVVLVLAAVLSAVLPGVDANSVHVVIDPLSLILSSVQPCVGSETLDLILLPVSIILGPVVPAVEASAVLLTGEVLSLIDRAIGPRLLAVPVLEVVHPLAFISGAVHVDVDALAVGLVVHPVAFVDVAVDMGELAEALGSVVLPVALIACTIGPDLLSIAISEATDPLTSICGSGLISVCRPLLALRLRVVRRIGDGLSQLDLGEISAVSALGLLDELDLLASRVPSPQSLKSDDQMDVLLEIPEVGFSFGLTSSLICRALKQIKDKKLFKSSNIWRSHHLRPCQHSRKWARIKPPRSLSL